MTYLSVITSRRLRHITASIVAVHGLNGHRENSWTAENRVNWLQHLLPQKVPHARIFSYGYDARTHGFVSQQHLQDHGVALVAELSLHRRDTQVGPPEEHSRKNNQVK